MRMTVQLTGLQQLRAQLAGVSERRLAAIAATGLTRTAKRASALWQERIDTKVENPMAFTRKAVRIEPARANKLSAKVAVKDVNGRGLSQAEYLQQHEYGGGRVVKKFERSLIASGVMPQGYITVPGRGVERNGYGNVPRSTIIAVLRQVATSVTRGYDRTISRDAGRRARANARHGTRYFVMPVGNPQGVSPGIYSRDAMGALRMVFAFRRLVQYSRKLTLEQAARDDIPTIATEELERALRESLARLRARGG